MRPGPAVRYVVSFALLLSGASSAVAIECPPANQLRRVFPGGLPIGGSYTPKDPSQKSKAQQRAGAALASMWANPSREPEPAARDHVVAVANALWLEARAVAATASSTGVCPGGCPVALDFLRGGEWAVAELGEIMLTMTRDGWRGFEARLARHGLTWSVRCRQGDAEGVTDCAGELGASEGLAAVYVPDASNQLLQTLRVACGAIAFRAGEGGRTLEVRPVPAGTYSMDMTLSKRIMPESARASSQLKGPYGADLAADGRASTAWVEGVAGMGVGEWIELRWARPRAIGEIAVYPGFGKSRALFLANGRVKRARAVFSDGHEVELSFEDVPALQHRGLFEPVPLQPPWETPVTSMRLEILEATPGTKHEDTCIAEIRLFAP